MHETVNTSTCQSIWQSQAEWGRGRWRDEELWNDDDRGCKVTIRCCWLWSLRKQHGWNLLFLFSYCFSVKEWSRFRSLKAFQIYESYIQTRAVSLICLRVHAACRSHTAWQLVHLFTLTCTTRRGLWCKWMPVCGRCGRISVGGCLACCRAFISTRFVKKCQEGIFFCLTLASLTISISSSSSLCLGLPCLTFIQW